MKNQKNKGLPCSVPSCTREAKCKGMCFTHYQRKAEGRPLDTPIRQRDPLPDACVIIGCDLPPAARGMCQAHYVRARAGSTNVAPVARMSRTLWERIGPRIEIDDSGCWIWTGSKNSLGYGEISYRGSKWRAHRAAYTALVGPIPDGLVLDHLCRTPSCVNPAHLEPVTQAENIRRAVRQPAKLRTHCPQGHPYDEVNTYVYVNKKGITQRHCRTCQRARNRKRE
jgi:hypothetical protein